MVRDARAREAILFGPEELQQVTSSDMELATMFNTTASVGRRLGAEQLVSLSKKLVKNDFAAF